MTLFARSSRLSMRAAARVGAARSRSAAVLRVLVAALCLGGRASAGDLAVHPAGVELSQRQPTAVVTVRNRSPQPTRCRVDVFAWAQEVDGEMKLSPTRDVTASPGELRLAPGESHDVLITASAGFGRVEKPYRLSVEELPPARTGDGPRDVPVLSRVGIPVFLAAARPEHDASLEGLAVSAGRVRFSLRARGTVHIRPAAVKVTGVAEGGAPAFEKSGDTWYVLAGGERQYDLAVPAEACARVRGVRVDVRFLAGAPPLHAEVATPLGACGR